MTALDLIQSLAWILVNFNMKYADDEALQKTVFPAVDSMKYLTFQSEIMFDDDC